MFNFEKVLSITLFSFWLLVAVAMGDVGGSLKHLRFQESNGSLYVPPEVTPDDSQMPDHYYVLECDYRNTSVSVYDAWYNVSDTHGSSSEVQKGFQGLEDEPVGNFTNRKLKIISDGGVILTDERQLVSSTQIYPWNTIGLIRIYTIAGYVGACTGTLIAPRVVLTAASCIYDLSNNRFFDALTFAPGETYISEPYGVYNVERTSVKTAYALGFKSFDFGLLLLESEPPVYQYMSFGYNCFKSSMTLNIAGYPYDKSFLAISLDMFRTVCTEGSIDMCPSGADLFNLIHFCDATIGMEGAPMWEYDPDTKQRTIRAVHYGGDFLANDAAAITPYVYNFITDNFADWGQP